jgi:hypothetical protein
MCNMPTKAHIVVYNRPIEICLIDGEYSDSPQITVQSSFSAYKQNRVGQGFTVFTFLKKIKYAYEITMLPVCPPFQLWNQLTDFHETCNEKLCHSRRSQSHSLHLIFWDQ